MKSFVKYSTFQLPASALQDSGLRLPSPVLLLWAICQVSYDQILCHETMRSKLQGIKQSSNGQKNQLEGEKFADITSFLGLHEV